MMTLISDPSVALSRAAVVDRFHDEGFDTVAVTTPDAIPQVPERLQAFLDARMHGTMNWLENRADWRADPTVLWPEVKTIFMVGLKYGPEADPLPALERKDRGVISVYARHRDYHDVIKKRLKRVGRWLVDQTDAQIKVFVDTAPVAEKPLAEAAGLGWQGKHTNLVSRTHGSWLFLGALFTDLIFEADAPEQDHCGSCQACLDICPTNAFPTPYRLDARRCISYLTIEHKGHIAPEFRAPMGNRIYGCDDCLAVCPWNKYAQMTEEPAFMPREDLTAPLLADLVMLDDTAFRARFSGSPIKRIGRDRFVRNVLIALGNSGDETHTGVIEPLLDDASPLVRAMAVWALARLTDPVGFKALKQAHLPQEADSAVAQEWVQASPQ